MGGGVPYTPVRPPQVVLRSFSVKSLPGVPLRNNIPETHSQQLVSLILSETEPFKSEGLGMIFLPWREYLDYIRCTPGFPFSFVSRPDSLVMQDVILRPMVNFTRWTPQFPGDVYADYPPSTMRGDYVVYWGLNVLVNACRAVLNRELTSDNGPAGETNRRLWLFYAAHVPIMQVFFDYYKENGEIPSDAAYFAAVERSPLKRTRFTHPTLHIPFVLSTGDLSTKLEAHDQVVESAPPLVIALEKLREMAWFGSGLSSISWMRGYEACDIEETHFIDAALAVDFAETVDYVRDVMSVARRQELYAQFKHFNLEQLEGAPPMDCETMTIVFAACWRINRLYALMHAVMEAYGASVNVAALDLTAATSGMFDSDEAGEADDETEEGGDDDGEDETGHDPKPPSKAKGRTAAPVKKGEAKEQERMRKFLECVESILRESGPVPYAVNGDGGSAPPGAVPRINRHRRILDVDVREKVLYNLKAVVTSHCDLILCAWHGDMCNDAALLTPVSSHTWVSQRFQVKRKNGKVVENYDTDVIVGTWYERFFPWPHRALGYNETRDLSCALADVAFFGKDPNGIPQQNPNQKTWQVGLFLEAIRNLVLDRKNLRTGVDAFGVPFADVFGPRSDNTPQPDILFSTYHHGGQNQAFYDFLSPIIMCGLNGVTPTSNTTMPFTWILGTIEKLTPATADPVQTAMFANRNAKVVRLLLKEHVFNQLTPVLRQTLARCYPQLYASLVLQSSITADEVRAVLGSELRTDRPRFKATAGERLTKLVVQRTKPKGKKQPAHSEKTLSAEKKAKHEVQTRYKEEMMPVSNVIAERDVYALCAEIIDHHRTRNAESTTRMSHPDFYDYVVRMYLEANLRPKDIPLSDVDRPLKNHAYKLVPAETRRAIVQYARTHITRDTRIDLECLVQFGVSASNCGLLSGMREMFCGPQSCKTSTRCVFQFPRIEQFVVYFAFACFAQVMSYRIIEVGDINWSASQMQRCADILNVSPIDVPDSLHQIVFSERTGKLLSSVSVCAIGPKGAEHSIVTGNYYDGATDVMKKRKEYPPLGLVSLDLIGRIIQFTRPMKTSSKFRRRLNKRNGDGGLGSSRHTALRVQREFDEAVFQGKCNPKVYALQALDSIVQTRGPQSRDLNVIVGREVVSRHMPSVRTAYPLRRGPFVVPDTPPRHNASFVFGKRVRVVWLADCCGMATRYSPSQLNVWDDFEYVWCGYCRYACGAARYIPICIVCQCYVDRKLADKRIVVYDDRGWNNSWTQTTVCDNCHYTICERSPGRTMTVTEARAMAVAKKEGRGHSMSTLLAL